MKDTRIRWPFIDDWTRHSSDTCYALISTHKFYGPDPMGSTEVANLDY